MFSLPLNGIFLFTGKTVTPKSVSDVKLIHAGKVLENSKTLADSRITFGDIPGGVITMHVVVQPPVAKKKTGLFNLFICAYAEAYRLCGHGYDKHLNTRFYPKKSLKTRIQAPEDILYRNIKQKQ